MTKSEIIRMQKAIGAVPDGFWGPKSEATCRKHLKSMMPKSHPFPPQAGVTKFYGPHGVPKGAGPPTKKIILPFSVYYGGKAVKALNPHKLCADSLLRVFERLAKVYPTGAERQKAGILTYNGLYNARKMRGGDSWSMHSWAIAIDFDAGRNGNLTHWPARAVMPLEVMECFAREGWMSAGAFWARDAMHFQATSP